MWRDWPAQRLRRHRAAHGVVYSAPRLRPLRPGPRRARRPGRPGARLHAPRGARGCCRRCCARCGIDAPVLVGHSDGGTIALLHASRHPVAACVVMAPHVIVEDVSIAASARRATPIQAATCASGCARYHADVDGAFWQWNDIWLERRVPRLRHPPRLPPHRRAACWRSRAIDDPYGTMRQIDEIAPTAGRFAWQVCEHCGHSPHKDQPERRARAPSGVPGHAVDLTERREVVGREPAPLARRQVRRQRQGAECACGAAPRRGCPRRPPCA